MGLTGSAVRYVRVVKCKPVGADASIVQVEDPNDLTWPGAEVGLDVLVPVGTEGHLQFLPGGSARLNRTSGPGRWADGPAPVETRVDPPVETGRPEAGCQAPDGSGPAGEPGGGWLWG